VEQQLRNIIRKWIQNAEKPYLVNNQGTDIMSYTGQCKKDNIDYEEEAFK
jgi:hypothetical protein